jgi:hypothetical protein
MTETAEQRRRRILAEIEIAAGALPPLAAAIPPQAVLAARIGALRFTGDPRPLLIEIAARALLEAEAVDVRRATPARRPIGAVN